VRNIFALLCAIVALSGCATTSTKFAPSPDKQPPAANEGIVVVSITGNTAQVNQFDEIALERKQEQKTPADLKAEFILTLVSGRLSRDTAVFVGVLPEGEYFFRRFSDKDTRKFLALSQSGSDLLGSFKVRPGKVADLGRLIATPINFRVLVGRSDISRSNRELVTRFLPEFAKHYGGNVDEGWVRARDGSDVAERYAMTHPIGSTSLVEMKNGEVAAATRMGTVLLRDANGRWRRAVSGKLESLLWVTPSDGTDSAILAAGEFNTLLHLDRRGQFRSLDSGDLPPGNILFIDGNDSVGWHIAHQSGEDVFIFRASSLSAPKWERLAQEKIGSSFWSGQEKFFIWRTSRGFAYGVSKGDIHVYDYTSRAWSHRRVPKDSHLAQIVVSPGDVWGVTTSPGGGFGGIFAGMYYSRDFGQTWTEPNWPFKIKVQSPMFTAKGTMLAVGGAFGKNELQGSVDDGKTWTPITERSLLPGTVWIMPTTGLFLVSDRLGVENIENSANDGANWKIEFSTFEKALFDQQTEKK